MWVSTVRTESESRSATARLDSPSAINLHTYQAQLCREAGHDVDDSTAAQLWVMEVATPEMHRAHAAVRLTGTPI